LQSSPVPCSPTIQGVLRQRNCEANSFVVVRPDLRLSEIGRRRRKRREDSHHNCFHVHRDRTFLESSIYLQI
jgi:hypothetical protein